MVQNERGNVPSNDIMVTLHHRHLKERTGITELWGFELGTQVVITISQL